jgi:3-hydroxyisobutyrate dehydrogenase-like beta-hydroxyacid dehydrogenase
MTVIAILGLGEAGSLIAADLVAAGATVQAFDPKLPLPPGDHTPTLGASPPPSDSPPPGVRTAGAGVSPPPGVRIAGAGVSAPAGVRIAGAGVSPSPGVRIAGAGVSAPAGVRIAGSDAEACAGASLVLSVNSAADATDALRDSLPALETGTIWADLNTATPGLKERLAALGGQRVRVVDVALMSPVPGHGLHTPMTASGPAAGELATVLGGFGATVEVLDGPVGTAATRKLLRSVFYKGMAAAVVEALEAAKAAGLEEWLRGNIRDELIRSNAATLDRLVDGSVKHAVRRRDEMAAATELLEELGLSPRIAPAARDVLEALIPPE